MDNRRYGEFHLRDYRTSIIGIIVLIVFAVASSATNLPYFFVVLPVLYAFIWIYGIVSPNLERFCINNGKIITQKCKKKQEISIPSELCLIVSYVDISPPLVKRTAFGNETHILKGKYAITILQRMPIETAIKHLHKNYIRKYTTSTIKTCFDEYLYVYSFVGNQTLLNQLLSIRNCVLIVPESLLNRVSINPNCTSIYVDVGY